LRLDTRSVVGGLGSGNYGLNGLVLFGMVSRLGARSVNQRGSLSEKDRENGQLCFFNFSKWASSSSSLAQSIK
jgi:hypothetical protein